MNLLALLAPALLSAAPIPLVEFAAAERTGLATARLVLVEASAPLRALCFDPDGLAPETLESAKRSLLSGPVFLYVGPRRAAKGRVTSVGTAASTAAPCAVVAEATFEDGVPLVASADVLWATTRERGSTPREPVPRRTSERALAALPSPLALACARPLAMAARAGRSGAFTSLVCAGPEGDVSALVYVPRTGQGRLLLTEEAARGQVALLDVLDPAGKAPHTLILARSLEGERRLERWRSDGASMEKLPELF